MNETWKMYESGMKFKEIGMKSSKNKGKPDEIY